VQHPVQQPNSHFCFVCGLRNVNGLQVKFFSDGISACRAEITIDERFQSFPKMAHGGIVASLLDEALTRAPLAGDPMRLFYTGKLEVRYRQPTPLLEPLQLIGRVQRDRGRVVVASATLTRADGTLLAEADGTLFALPPDVLAGFDLDQVGWEVVP